MVFIKLLGLMDLASIIIVILFKYGLLPQSFVIAAIIYLAAKALFFFKDVASFVDFGVVVVLSLTLFGIFNVLTWIALLWVLQKSILSLIA